jgi:hypothetical protein
MVSTRALVITAMACLGGLALIFGIAGSFTGVKVRDPKTLNPQP